METSRLYHRLSFWLRKHSASFYAPMVTHFGLGGNDEILPETERDVEPSAFVFRSIDLRLFYWYPHCGQSDRRERAC